MRNGYRRFEEAGGRVAVVTMGTPEQVASFFRDLPVTIVCLADPQQQAYRAYGLRQGGWWQIAGPRVWLPSIRALVRGGVGRPVGDVRQLPGTFVIDRAGLVRFAHRPDNQADRPSHEQIVAVLKSLGG